MKRGMWKHLRQVSVAKPDALTKAAALVEAARLEMRRAPSREAAKKILTTLARKVERMAARVRGSGNGRRVVSEDRNTLAGGVDVRERV